jgi:Fe-S oxidoreductase
MLWNGRLDVFQKLAAQNVELIRDAGAKQVIFSCPEGYYTFKNHYPQYLGTLGFEVVHFYDFVARMLNDGALKPGDGNGCYTYHDPCRLGRMARVFDGPRTILESIPGIRFVEMERNRENAVCCGTSGWANCSMCSKQIQVERLKEAKAAGAEVMVTACPKCKIHLSCALSNMDLDLQIEDLTNLIARGTAF